MTPLLQAVAAQLAAHTVAWWRITRRRDLTNHQPKRRTPTP